MSDRKDGEGSGIAHLPSLFTYSEIFKEQCAYFMSIGMTYSDYWDGDCTMVKYYVDADRLRREKENYNLWLQGAYIYEALLDASPILNALSGKNKPIPYRSTPIPIPDHKETVKEKELTNKEKMENGKEAMRLIMANVNQKFKRD